MDLRGIRCHSSHRIEYCRKGFVLYLYGMKSLECCFFINCCHGSHIFTHIPYLISGQHIMVLCVTENTPFYSIPVLSAHGCFNSRNFQRWTYINSQDSRVSIRTPQHLGHEHSWQLQVCRITGLPRHLGKIVRPNDPLTDNLVIFHEPPLCYRCPQPNFFGEGQIFLFNGDFKSEFYHPPYKRCKKFPRYKITANSNSLDFHTSPVHHNTRQIQVQKV